MRVTETEKKEAKRSQIRKTVNRFPSIWLAKLHYQEEKTKILKPASTVHHCHGRKKVVYIAAEVKQQLKTTVFENSKTFI